MKTTAAVGWDIIAPELTPFHLKLFWSRVGVDESHKCWQWRGAKTREGYGRFRLLAGRVVLAHRLAYGLTYGGIPEAMFVLHKCDNPPCCNPAHLRVGTQAENIQDAIAKGRVSQLSGNSTAAVA